MEGRDDGENRYDFCVARVKKNAILKLLSEENDRSIF